jgi:hypothetical protein
MDKLELAVMSRDIDFIHYLKCPCGWEGFIAWMIHSYQGHGYGDNCDVEPMDICPKCGRSEDMAEVVVECSGNCLVCPDRFNCLTTFDKLPLFQFPKENKLIGEK